MVSVMCVCLHRISESTANRSCEVVKYAWWESDRGQGLDGGEVKSLVREIHSLAVERGKNVKLSTQPLVHQRNTCGFFNIITPRSLIPWLAQVDHGRINMKAQENIDYFNIV